MTESIVTRLHKFALQVENYDCVGGDKQAQALRDIADEVSRLQSAQALGGSWFAVLKGNVLPAKVVPIFPAKVVPICNVVQFRDENDPRTKDLVLDVHTRNGYWHIPAPAGAAEDEVYWIAVCDAVKGKHAVGKTPAEAIAAFNQAMVTP